MLREYGSDLPALVDKPINASLITGFIAATAIALARWEPRLLLKRVEPDITNAANGQIALTLEAWYKPGGYFIRLDNIVLDFTL